MKSPSICDLRAALDKAATVGSEAATAEVARKRRETNTDGPFDSCGTAYIVLKIRRNSSLGKLIDANPKPLTGVSIEYCSREKGYVLGLRGMVGRQELYINRLAEEAALGVLQEELGISGGVRSFLN
jgi:hypothetical protein